MPKRVDANQTAIVNALRWAGCSVQSLATVGKGCPDLLVGKYGITVLMEIKDGDKGKVRDSQVEWMDNWMGGPVAVVRSIEDALRAVGVM
jgi:Holliday junction resolvase